MVALTRYRDVPTGLFGLRQLDRLLNQALAGMPIAEPGEVIAAAWLPPSDIVEDAERLRITLEVPGVRPEDVKLSLENNLLTVRGEKKQEARDETGQVHRYERSYGIFERTFALPSTVDPERIEARYENGVLNITIAKAERARPREIPVQTGEAGTPAGAGPGSTRKRGAEAEAAATR